MCSKPHTVALCVLAATLLVTGCGPSSTPTLHAPAVDTLTPGTVTAEALPTAHSSPTLSPTTSMVVPTPTEPALEINIAYTQNDELFVTHILAGVPLDTRHYIQSEQRGGIFNVGWSPSGEYVSFNLYTSSFPHVFVVHAYDGSPPVDLGIANGWAWSPDSRLLAFDHEYELWGYSPDNGRTQRLTTNLGWDWLCPNPVFSPAGDALVTAGSLLDDMDRHGTTLYRIYRVPLSSSGAPDCPPANLRGITEEITGRLPLAMRFSPDGEKLALITSEYVDGCATLTQYFVANADGSDLRELPVPSLAALGGPDQKMYFYGDSLAWAPDNDGLWVNGHVIDCRTTRHVAGGPQISRMTLDGQEHEIIPGPYGNVSLDSTGSLLAVVHRVENYPSRVQILGRDGHLVLDLGEGDWAVLDPSGSAVGE